MRRAQLCWMLAILWASGCDDDGGSQTLTDTSTTDAPSDDTQLLVLDDPLGLDIVLTGITARAEGVGGAALDLVDAYAAANNATVGEAHVLSSLADADSPQIVEVRIDAGASLSDEGYQIKAEDFGGGRAGLLVTASTEAGAMYGLYDIAKRLGVQYIHPEQTVFPSAAPAALADLLDGAPDITETPDFARRGFHEHTQHPTVASDIFLRPGNAEFRTFVSHYLRWMARNRQNTLSFHLLKTVDLEAWAPYIAEIAAEADRYHVELGVVVSLSDQQQNNFKLIRDDITDPLTGQVPPADTQIQSGLDLLFGAGLDFVVLQIGTSEFTKPTDAEVLGWLDVALTHTRQQHPGKRLDTWIHIFCGLEDEKGGYFYHLPLEADATLGAWVHTTMFYTLDDPAPVYDCEDFTHQIDFMHTADAQSRPQTFFPESAWWLGFDNNLPLALPVTGWSRAKDIGRVLSDHQVEGHVTFTTGREWGYWQYDHFLTRATWDGDLSWDAYLDDLSLIYGANAAPLQAALSAWTDLQVQHFYEQNPGIYFYLAGELPQDEVGERAGILARPPKLGFKAVVEMDDPTFTEWQTRDLAMLGEMQTAYQTILDTLPASDASDALYHEARTGLALYVLRTQHAKTLYEGVLEVRAWAEEQRAADAEGRTPSEDIKTAARAAAESKLVAAQDLSDQAQTLIRSVEGSYRYPLELLIEPKPDSLTAYPFGYLKETHDAFFWHRRDEQLARLIVRNFDASTDAWLQNPPDQLFVTDSSRTTMLTPNDRLAGAAISSFIPQLLFGLSAVDLTAGTLTLTLAEDFNENFLPDPGTEKTLSLARDLEGLWQGTMAAFPIQVRDSSEVLVGTLAVYDAQWTLHSTDDGLSISALTEGHLQGEIASAELVGIIRSVAGIDVNGTEALIKQIYKLPSDQPIPERLPIWFKFTFARAD